MHAGEQWIERRSFGRTLDKMLRREAGAREVAGRLIHLHHLHHIYEKLNVDGRHALTVYARDKGLV